MTTANRNNPETERLIRLKIDGASTTVNTVGEQQIGKGLSLICPFPSLEVRIPVRFQGAEKSEMSGVIHRIGVEDDPQTGLPKLRLAIRTDEGAPESHLRETVLNDDATAAAALRAATANTDPMLQRSTPSFDGSFFDILDNPSPECDAGDFSMDADELFTMDDFEDSPVATQLNEPAWADGSDLPLSVHRSDPLKTRRRQRVVALMAWMMILGIGAGGATVLGKAGVQPFGTWFQAFFGGIQAPHAIGNDAAEDALARLNHAEDASDPSESAARDELLDATPVAHVTPESEASAAHSANEDVIAAASEDSAPPAEAVEENIEETREEVSLTLPTRWPVEYASAYRLRDPNGVVVDIPGGLVRREGWIDAADKHPMIRSIKATQREGGARFIVYINGDLPRFMTAPNATGVELKLSREVTDFPGQTERVALLSR